MLKIASSKTLSCTVELLDGRELTIESSYLQNAEKLLSYVCQQIGTGDVDFFGLRYTDMRDGKISWVDINKPLPKQLKKANGKFKLGIQFFPESVHFLQDEVTRYHFVLQTRENLLTGRWYCSIPTQALLASYIVQAEFDNYDAVRHGTSYLDGTQFTHFQDDDFTEKVSLFHRSHKNISSSDADWLYMKTAHKMVLYGMEMFDVMDADGNCMSIGVDIHGIHILHLNTVLHSFLWPLITKIHYHGKELFINIKVSLKDVGETLTVVFLTASELDAKRITKSSNSHREFALYGTLKKNLKNPSKPTCTHVSSRIMAKEFRRVSSKEFSQRFQTDGTDRLWRPPDTAESIASDQNELHSYVEDPNLLSSSPGPDISYDEAFELNTLQQTSPRPSSLVIETKLKEASVNVCHPNDNDVKKEIVDPTPSAPIESCDEGCCEAAAMPPSKETCVIEPETPDDVFTPPIEPTTKCCNSDVTKTNAKEQPSPAENNGPNGHLTNPETIKEDGETPLDLDVLVIEESDLHVLLSGAHTKTVSTSSLLDDFEIIENSYDYATPQIY